MSLNETGSRLTKIVSIVAGTSLACSVAFAASNWVVGLTAGSSAAAQAATVSNLTILVKTPIPNQGNQLYPGGTGDVQLQITNPNNFPVTLTGITVPTSTTYAAGYTDSSLTPANAVAGCVATVGATASLVNWGFSTGAASAHTFTTPLVIGPSGDANNPLVVTLTKDASMGNSSPLACEALYFQMPSLTLTSGQATAGGSPVNTTPTTDAYTS